jgi:hypothetical protein
MKFRTEIVMALFENDEEFVEGNVFNYAYVPNKNAMLC